MPNHYVGRPQVSTTTVTYFRASVTVEIACDDGTGGYWQVPLSCDHHHESMAAAEKCGDKMRGAAERKLARDGSAAFMARWS